MALREGKILVPSTHDAACMEAGRSLLSDGASDFVDQNCENVHPPSLYRSELYNRRETSS